MCQEIKMSKKSKKTKINNVSRVAIKRGFDKNNEKDKKLYENLITHIQELADKLPNTDESRDELSDLGNLFDPGEECLNSHLQRKDRNFKENKIPNKRELKKEDSIVNRIHSARGSYLTIPLWHSGFHVTVRSPSPNEMHKFIARCHEKLDSYGMIGSAPFYLQKNIIFSLYVYDLLDNCILDSTLENWNKNGNAPLRENVAISDIDTIVAYLSSLIAPANQFDYNFKTFCSECKHVEPLNIDSKKLVLIDEDSIPEKLKKQMKNSEEGKTISQENAIKYRKNILRKSEDEEEQVFSEINIGESEKLEIYYEIPTISSVLEIYKLITRSLSEKIKNDAKKFGENYDKEAVIRFFRLCEFSPWIRLIKCNIEDKVIKADTKKSIHDILTSYVEYDTDEEIYEKLNDLVLSKKFTLLGYLNQECRECGHIDDENIRYVNAFELGFLMASSGQLALMS